MTTFITLISVALLAAMVTSSWGDLQESSPARDIEGPPALSPSELGVTKGTYICGNKLCLMTPDQVPKDCPPGLCQHPRFGPMDYLDYGAK